MFQCHLQYQSPVITFLKFNIDVPLIQNIQSKISPLPFLLDPPFPLPQIHFPSVSSQKRIDHQDMTAKLDKNKAKDKVETLMSSLDKTTQQEERSLKSTPPHTHTVRNLTITLR